MTKEDNKKATTVEVSVNTMCFFLKLRLSKGADKPLKHNRERYRLGLCGRDSIFCLRSLGSSSSKNFISERYELLILLQQPACWELIPDFVETHNYSEGDLTGPKKKEKKKEGISRLCLPSVFPH